MEDADPGSRHPSAALNPTAPVSALRLKDRQLADSPTPDVCRTRVQAGSRPSPAIRACRNLTFNRAETVASGQLTSDPIRAQQRPLRIRGPSAIPANAQLAFGHWLRSPWVISHNESTPWRSRVEYG